MPLQVLVTTNSPKQGKVVLPDGREIYDFLEAKGQQPPVTVQIRDIVDKVFDEVQQTVGFECVIELTLTGSLTLTGGGDAKFLLFNVSGSTEAATSMSVKLTTKLAAQNQRKISHEDQVSSGQG